MRLLSVNTGPIEILIFQTTSGKEPFVDWVQSLDKTNRARIFSRLDRLEQGNFGDCKSLGDNMFELRFPFGPGFRLYFGKSEKTIILLLTGGNKSTQSRDIEKAHHFWNEYRERNQ